MTVDKAAAYITFRVEQKRAELAAEGPTRLDVLPETSLFNRARDIIPVLERYAKWQGYLELSKKLSTQGAVELVYTELLRNSNTAKAEQPIDYGADSRRMAKRLAEEERSRFIRALWSPTDMNPFQIMRRLTHQLLLAAIGRRGEDIREVGFYFEFLQFIVLH